MSLKTCFAIGRPVDRVMSLEDMEQAIAAAVGSSDP